jgi:hypothetical protein
MNLTIKNTFLLLALFVSAVGGNHLEYAMVEGDNDEGVDFCSASVYDELYHECIVDVAKEHNVVFDGHEDRRLELRGSRRLGCEVCTAQASGSRGHWCYYQCGEASRRLQAADDHANESIDMTTHAYIEGNATECYIEKALPLGNVACLGDWTAINVTINYH